MRGSYRSKTSINRHKTRKTRQNRKKEKRNNRGSNLLVLFYTFIPTNHANRFPEFNNYVRKKMNAWIDKNRVKKEKENSVAAIYLQK